MRHLIEVSIRFVARDSEQATLTIAAVNLPTYILTVLHERQHNDILVTDIRGAGTSEPLAVKDGESLTFLARRDGEIVACALCEVAVDVAAQLGYLLLPRAQCNMELLQIAVTDESGLHQVVEAESEAERC